MSQRQILPRNVKGQTPVDSPKTPSPSDVRELIRSNKDVLLSINSIKDEIESFRRCVASLEQKVDQLGSSLATFHARQTKCESDIKSIKLAVENLKAAQSSNTADILGEAEERQRRANNIMIFGLPETMVGSLAERVKLDEDNIQELFSETGVAEISPISARRVGKIVEGQCRPLKVEMQRSADVQRVLRSGRRLRNSSRYRRVFVSKDLTKLQQEEARNLRSEMKQRRELGEDVVIFRNQVVRRDTLPIFHE